MYFRLISISIVSLCVIAFALQNTTTVNISLWFWNVESSLALVVIYCIAGGALITGFLSIPSIIKKRKQISSLINESKILQDQLSQQKKDASEIKSPNEHNS